MTSRPEPGEDVLESAGAASADPPDADRPPVADERLLAAHDLARAALAEITPESTVGDPVEYTLEADGVVSLRFANRLAGYPGWFWTVSLTRVDDADPTVLEAELLPGDGALLAPEWVPWAVRLAEYQAQQQAALDASAVLLEDIPDGDLDATDDLDDEDLDDDADLDDDEDLDDVDDLDAVDFDTDGSPILHAGDLDGVDIDELADDGEEGGEDDDGYDDEADEDDDGLDDDDHDDEEGDVSDAQPADLDGLADDDFVSDEDDLGEDELSEGPAGQDEAVDEGGALTGEG